MQLAALRHRPESEDCFVIGPHHVRVRFHSAKDDVRRVIVHYTDNYLPPESAQTVAMEKVGQGQVTDYWAATLAAPYRRLKYCFEVIGTDGSSVLVGDRGLQAVNAQNLNKDGSYFKVPYLHRIDMDVTPDWVKHTVWYQIFPERFANGDKSNDPANVKPWRPKDHPGRQDYYGGDLQGIIDHLDYLQKLGVNGLYLCPIFKAASNHKYDTIDYLQVDPEFGDKKLFAKLVNEAHQRGMHIMLDAVFNHLGDQSMQWQDVVKNGPQSRFADWFHINRFPVNQYHDPSQGQGKPEYDTFAFERHMPKLNTANPEVQDFLLEIATYWVKYFDIDAWRLDVANEIDHHFWRRFHNAVTAIKPDFYIVGEIWHSAQPWLNGDEFSGVMNYPYTLQIEDHFFKHRLTAKQLTEHLTDQLMLYRDATNQVMMNMLDSHDTARILTLAKGDQELALQALTFMFTQTGSPCIYYGTEMGMSGGEDPDCRKPMDWDKANGPVWQQVHHLIQFRLRYASTFSKGKLYLAVTPAGLIKVRRQGEKQITAYFNTTDHAVSLNLDSKLSQNYHDQLLSPKGFAISVKH